MSKPHIGLLTKEDALHVANMIEHDVFDVAIKTQWGYLIPSKRISHSDFCIVLPTSDLSVPFAIGYSDEKLTSNVDKMMSFLFEKYSFKP